MIELNAPKGLGDTIYLRAVALHLLGRGERLKIWTRWREVFTGLDVTFADAESVDALIAKREREPRYDLRNVTACLHCRVPYIMARDKFALACLQAKEADCRAPDGRSQVGGYFPDCAPVEMAAARFAFVHIDSRFLPLGPVLLCVLPAPDGAGWIDGAGRRDRARNERRKARVV